MQFDWTASKNALNVANHKIQFADAVLIFDGPVVVRRSDQHGEERYVCVGRLPEIFGRPIIAVVYHDRGEVRRIISARGARDNEKREYIKTYG
jgi:uncharacterized DUF497 family protein